jgi:hypothetical protein
MKANIFDALFTAATFGIGGVGLRVARFGRVNPWRQAQSITSVWKGLRWWHKGILQGISHLPHATRWFGCRYRMRRC